MKRSTATIAVLVVGAALLPAHSASAADLCGGVGYWASTWTEAYASTECQAQARIDRYVSSTVKTYLGPTSSYSFVSNSSGVNAGNAYRVRKAAGYPYSAWIWIH
ncbi:MAG: hypothetical protein MUF33_11225 [Candidatus Nanopelagicales bacterium]|jgi:hypothetical protein|nr:hypothetical protein [Candidatus Nanopelagicales bacterium]